MLLVLQFSWLKVTIHGMQNTCELHLLHFLVQYFPLPKSRNYAVRQLILPFCSSPSPLPANFSGNVCFPESWPVPSRSESIPPKVNRELCNRIIWSSLISEKVKQASNNGKRKLTDPRLIVGTRRVRELREIRPVRAHTYLITHRAFRHADAVFVNDARVPENATLPTNLSFCSQVAFLFIYFFFRYWCTCIERKKRCSHFGRLGFFYTPNQEYFYLSYFLRVWASDPRNFFFPSESRCYQIPFSTSIRQRFH